MKAITQEKWSHSGISQHYQHCTHKPSNDNFSVVKNMQGKNKKLLSYDMRIREALEIRRHNSGPGGGLASFLGLTSWPSGLAGWPSWAFKVD